MVTDDSEDDNTLQPSQQQPQPQQPRQQHTGRHARTAGNSTKLSLDEVDLNAFARNAAAVVDTVARALRFAYPLDFSFLVCRVVFSTVLVPLPLPTGAYSNARAPSPAYFSPIRVPAPKTRVLSIENLNDVPATTNIVAYL